MGKGLLSRLRSLERRVPEPARDRGLVRLFVQEEDGRVYEDGRDVSEEFAALSEGEAVHIVLADLVPDERTLAARAADVVAEVADRAIAAVKDVTERVMTPEPEPELPDFGVWSYEALYARARQQIAMRERLAIEAELNRRARVDRGDEPARRVDVEREAADRPSWAAAGSIVH